MSLSCSCDFYGDEPEWYWWPPEDFSEYKRWKGMRCCSRGCENWVYRGDIVAEVTRSRMLTEWEKDRGFYGEGDPQAVWLGSTYMCEDCAGLYFSFDDLGFECVSPYENMRELAKEYHEVYGGGK